MRKRLIWHYSDRGCLQTGLLNNGIQYIIEYKRPLEDELEPEWKAFRRQANCDSEIYCGYNLAKALKHCEIDNERNKNS